MKALIIAAFCLLSSTLFAQIDTSNHSLEIESVSLEASGLTCSMCSKAIYKSLLKVPFVTKVDPNIENSSYMIYINEKFTVKLEDLRKAVENAGFSVRSMQVNRVSKKEEQ